MVDTLNYKVSATLQKTLQNYGVVKLYQADDVLLNESAYVKSIPIVIKGSIKVIRTDESGKEILLYYIGPWESCIMSFLGGIHQDTSKIKAIAEEETEVLFVPVEKVILLVKENPEWLDYIFKLYHKRFEELLEVVNSIAFKKIDNRLLELLEKKATLHSTRIISVTHEQLANELGTARVVISRLLKQMEYDGLVKLGRNKITIL